jgi:hypothetical protein
LAQPVLQSVPLSVTLPVPAPEVVTVRLNMGATVTLCVTLLFDGIRSGWEPETLAAFVAEPGFEGTTTMVTFAEPPETILPIAHVTTRLACMQEP